jgi:stress response protein YsnF
VRVCASGSRPSTSPRRSPVRKERAVLETEPITEANIGNATSGPELSSEEHEVILHEERPVVQKTVEPVERVRLGTETVQSEETITEEVRSERVDVDGDGDLDQRR